MPSRRPVKPSPSVVVAFTLTRSTDRCRRCARCWPPWRRDAGRCAAPRRPGSGRDARCGRRARRAGRRRGAGSGRTTAPRHCGSEGGKCLPMSPAPIVPSTASVSACSATSASEWPAERMVVRDRDAAQHHGVAGPEAMHVEAQRGAGLHRDAAREILGRRDLAVVLAAFDHHHLQSGALRDRGVIGQRGRLRRAERRRVAMRLQQRSVAEDLRRLRAPEVRPRDGFADGAVGVRRA